MPIRSRAQQRWMFATHPAMAKRWAAETPNMKNLPARVGKKKKRKHRPGSLAERREG
jgi:hypothetical protein